MPIVTSMGSTSFFPALVASAIQVVTALARYYVLFFYFAVLRGSYSQCTVMADSLAARVHVYSLVLTLRIWNKPHYRNGTFQDDLCKNLRNVAIPGTGVPLSIFCFFKPLAYFFFLFVYPLVCLVSALRRSELDVSAIGGFFREQLLTPQDWCSYWQLNCRLASYHAAVTGVSDYDMENKWAFLQHARKNDIAVSPWLEVEDIVVKDRNEEGGMGIHFFRSATHGGDWVIQQRLHNHEAIASLLPPSAPLSTVRVITGSRLALHCKHSEVTSTAKALTQDEAIVVFSGVFRAGRAHALTDHVSILFDLDLVSGRLGNGTTNAHWYQLGPRAPLHTPWLSYHDIAQHPDTHSDVSGRELPDMDQVRQLVCDAHYRLIPHVAMAGWDVAYTDQGLLLLEVNLSCNFFRGTFDVDQYTQFVDDCFCYLEAVEENKISLK